jgi:hypothetical protein
MWRSPFFLGRLKIHQKWPSKHQICGMFMDFWRLSWIYRHFDIVHVAMPQNPGTIGTLK